MSTTIFLVKFGVTESGQLTENLSEEIESAYISLEILEEIQDFLTTMSIHEDKGEDSDIFDIEYFPDDKLKAVQSVLETHFVNLLKNKIEQEDVNSGSEGTFIRHSDIYEQAKLFRTITNLMYLFKLKIDKYTNDPSAIVKIG